MSLGPLMIDLAGLELQADETELLRHPLVGGVILFSRNFESREQVRALTDRIRACRDPALLIAVDQEGGRVQRFREGFTELPPLRWLGRMHDADPGRGRSLGLLTGRLMATELMDIGADFSFAPVVDLDYGICDVIGDRAAHPDPDVVAALTLAVMQGMRQAGMSAVAKHFPGHGAVTGDSHHVLPEDSRDYTDILDDLRPYSSLIADGLGGIMMAHIRYTAVDPEVASLSPFWMQRVLRDELGFSGSIFSDDLSMAGAAEAGGPLRRTQAALEAGADMALICNDRASVERVLGGLHLPESIAGHARLAALRSNKQRYAEAKYGSTEWQDMCTTLAQARATPVLELDGNG